MPLKNLRSANRILHQVSGDDAAPPLVFLPGVHGDWTPQVAARNLFDPNVRLIETAYPHNDRWSLHDFAESLRALLDELDIANAHIVGESFGSLVAWQFGIDNPERVRSFTLLGGFARPPRFRVAAAASGVLKVLPTRVIESGIDYYVAMKAKRGEARSTSHGAYPAARTDYGRLATANRMSLIQQSDFESKLGGISFPVRYIGGGRDVVVPVRREIATLSKYLPDYCNFQSSLVAGAPHALIASHPQETVNQILKWVRETEVVTEHGTSNGGSSVSAANRSGAGSDDTVDERS